MDWKKIHIDFIENYKTYVYNSTIIINALLVHWEDHNQIIMLTS